MNLRFSLRSTLIILVVFAGIIGAYLVSNATQSSSKKAESEISKKGKLSARRPSMDEAIKRARREEFSKIGHVKGQKVNVRKEMLVRMLAVSEGINKETPTEEDLSPELREFVNDPNPDHEKYRHIIKRVKKENDRRLDEARRKGILKEEEEENIGDTHPQYMPHGMDMKDGNE